LVISKTAQRAQKGVTMEKAVGPEQRHEDNVLSVLKRMGAPSNIIQRVTASVEAAERRRITRTLEIEETL
jgi:hypothetical protein